MHAQVTVGRAQELLELRKREGLVGCQSADDPEPDTLMNQPVQVWRAPGASRSARDGDMQLGIGIRDVRRGSLSATAPPAQYIVVA